MTRAVLVMIVISVLLSAVAQIALKSGMSAAALGRSIDGMTPSQLALSMASSPMVWVGLGIYALGMVAWLLVLARIDVSLAYPFVGLGFIVTMVLAWVVHDEAITPMRIAGTMLIVAGVVAISRD